MPSMKRRIGLRQGVGQLTLIEHALCPLDARLSFRPNLTHKTQYEYSGQRNRRTAQVQVYCPLGLMAQDEIFLWGMLALTLADPSSEGELFATRHYILKQLGMIDAGSRRGGRQYSRFTDAVHRLSLVRYTSTAFYDPVRSEHQRRTFGFFSYIMPSDPTSQRAWRLTWDPLFMELVQATGGKLRFDLTTYRDLDPASRRLYLFLSKLLGRKAKTHPLEIEHLAVNVIGYSKSLEPSARRFKVNKCLRKLYDAGVVRYSLNRLEKDGRGRYRIVVHRGPSFRKRRRSKNSMESPLVQPLADLGFDELGIERVLGHYPGRMVSEWLDITLAAKERFGNSFFRSSPAAYLVDNLKNAEQGTRTAPDWWHDIRKAEERANATRAKDLAPSCQENAKVPIKAMESLEDLNESIFQHFIAAGQAPDVALVNAKRFAALESREKCKR